MSTRAPRVPESRVACPATIALVGALALAWPRLAADARAQDFAFEPGAGPAPTAAALIERGLPGADGFRIETAMALRPGLAGWSTHAIAAGGALGPLALGAGASRTGDGALGWHAAGVAIGATTQGAGLALRAVLRSDHADAGGPPESRLGGEAGVGGWVRAGGGLELWAAAPQLWTRGLAPPLARPLEIGGALAAGDARWWVAQSFAAGAAGASSRRAAGAELHAGPATFGVHVRERPWRAAVAVWIRAGAIVAGTGVESHPALGETWLLSLALAADVR